MYIYTRKTRRHRYIDTEIFRHTVISPHRYTDTQTPRHIDTKTHTRTGTQTHRYMDIHTDIIRHQIALVDSKYYQGLSVLQRTAVCCSVLQCVALCCDVLQYVACVAMCCCALVT